MRKRGGSSPSRGTISVSTRIHAGSSHLTEQGIRCLRHLVQPYRVHARDKKSNRRSTLPDCSLVEYTIDPKRIIAVFQLRTPSLGAEKAKVFTLVELEMPNFHFGP